MVFNRFQAKPDYPTNDKLLKAIIALASQGMDKAGRAFYAAVLESNFLLAEEPDMARPILFSDENDEIVLPVFTDLERLQSVFPDAQRIGTMAARDVFRMALSNKTYRININPEQGPGGFLERYELEALVKGEIPDLSDAGKREWEEPDLVPFGSPKLPPQEVLDKMVETAITLMRREPGIYEAYLTLTRTAQDESVLTIGLYFAKNIKPDDKAAFSQQFVPAIEAVIERPMHLIWLEDRDVNAIRMNVEPFYTRATE
jgi:hypothetical protein